MSFSELNANAVASSERLSFTPGRLYVRWLPNFFFCSVSFLISGTAGSAPLTVAAVTTAQFSVGRAWSWDFIELRADGERLQATERYQVIQREGDVILLEMSTRLPGETGFSAHHRLRVPLDQCRGAYRDPQFPKAWALQMFYLDHGKWISYTGPGPIAFEEKFNCDANVHADSPRAETVTRDLGGWAIFAQVKNRDAVSSWYFADGDNAGVAAEKNFPAGRTNAPYVMRFHAPTE